MKDLFLPLLLIISFAILFLPSSLASFCGSSGVPFSFEVLPSGAPVLGCAQPSCVASPDERDDSNFLVNADGQSDGFLREGDRELKRSSEPYGNKLIANCSGKFADLTCPRKDQWVGGIEYIDHPRQPLILQCCTFAGLRFSQEVGVTNVGPGEAITGGEVIRDGRQISFDVIANARKVVDANTHVVSYEVTVRRMNCLPDPPEPVVDFEKGVSDEVVKVLTKASDRATYQKEKIQKKQQLGEDVHGDKAFAAPTQKIYEQKQLKKAGSEESENFNQPGQISQQQTGFGQQQQTESGTFSTPDAASTGPQSTGPYLAGGAANLESGTGGAGGFSGGLGFGGGRIPPDFQGQGQAFGQPLQASGAFGNPEPQQLPNVGPGPGFGPNQQAFGPYQPVSGQPFQPGQFYGPGPCSSQCNQRIRCPPRRCNNNNNNEGRDPIFGFPTFAPPTFFPTLSPFGTFPTFAPHTFPTPPPHTFPTLSPHLYPTIAPPPPSFVAAAAAGSGGGDTGGAGAPVAFGAPTHVAAAAVGEIAGDDSSGGGLAPLAPSAGTADTINTTNIPETEASSSSAASVAGAGAVPGGAPVFSGGRAPGATFAPLPSFEEFMARLGVHNMTLATLAPITFGTPSTPATTPSVPLPAVAVAAASPRPGGPPQVVPPESSYPFVQSVGVAPSSAVPQAQARHDQNPGSSVFYASQQWSPPGPDFIRARAAAFQHS